MLYELLVNTDLLPRSSVTEQAKADRKSITHECVEIVATSLRKAKKTAAENLSWLSTTVNNKITRDKSVGKAFLIAKEKFDKSDGRRIVKGMSDYSREVRRKK